MSISHASASSSGDHDVRVDVPPPPAFAHRRRALSMARRMLTTWCGGISHVQQPIFFARTQSPAPTVRLLNLEHGDSVLSEWCLRQVVVLDRPIEQMTRFREKVPTSIDAAAPARLRLLSSFPRLDRMSNIGPCDARHRLIFESNRRAFRPRHFARAQRGDVVVLALLRSFSGPKITLYGRLWSHHLLIKGAPIYENPRRQTHPHNGGTKGFTAADSRAPLSNAESAICAGSEGPGHLD